jgi:hypothetical protein
MLRLPERFSPTPTIGPDGAGESLEGLKGRAGPASLHAGDGRLGGAHAAYQLGLGQPGLGAQAVDQGAERADPGLVLIGGAALLGGAAAVP